METGLVLEIDRTLRKRFVATVGDLLGVFLEAL